MAKRKTKYTATDGKMVLVLEPAEEGGYCVSCPFIQGLNTQGETIEEAFEMAYDAAQCLKEARSQLRRELAAGGPDQGEPIPDPRKKRSARKAAARSV